MIWDYSGGSTVPEGMALKFTMKNTEIVLFAALI